MFYEPFQIKGFTVKNRAVLPPMCMYIADDDGIVKDFHITHYATRAIGQMALIIQEATAVTKEGRISLNDLGIWSDDHIAGLKRIADGIKANGGLAGIQINHAGRKSKTKRPLGPSAIPYYDGEPVYEMTIEDIKATVVAFKDAARRADAAGYDVLEIHAAHGYLLFEFMSPLTNKRTDAYGDRLLFLKEVTEAIASVWPKDKVLIIRVSAYEYRDEGLTPDTVSDMINSIKGLGIDMVDVSSGGNVPARIIPYPGYQLGYAKRVKELTGLPVVGGGLITTLDMAEYAIREGLCDFIYFGRLALRDPYFVMNRAKDMNVDLEFPSPYSRGKQ
ncbi:MAG: hypothetical protein K9K93_03095 [Acholeplasmataceae bacterium]|nr:hypothetical protein [Acholeplasmataceae bacterium]